MRSNPTGFTTVELMVSVAIFLGFSTFTLLNYPTFSNHVSLDLLVHDISLTIREAQVYGLGVRRYGATAVRSYGVHFDNVNTKSFILFADLDLDGKYDETPDCGVDNSECVQRYVITGKETIKSLCSITGGRSYAELTPGERGDICGSYALDITFTRPRPEANICVRNASDSSCTIVTDAEVAVASANDDTRTSIVFKSGQIAVK